MWLRKISNYFIDDKKEEIWGKLAWIRLSDLRNIHMRVVTQFVIFRSYSIIYYKEDHVAIFDILVPA